MPLQRHRQFRCFVVAVYGGGGLVGQVEIENRTVRIELLVNEETVVSAELQNGCAAVSGLRCDEITEIIMMTGQGSSLKHVQDEDFVLLPNCRCAAGSI